MDEPEARLATEERFGKTLITKKYLKTKANIVSITYGSNGTQIFKEMKKASFHSIIKCDRYSWCW